MGDVVLYPEGPWTRAADMRGFDYAAGKPGRLMARVSLPEALGCWTEFGDLDGDGHPEIVTVQSAFPYDLPANAGWQKSLDPEWRYVWCVTAADRTGRILWRHGKPYRGREAFPNHGGPGVIVGDVDGDGHVEAVTAHGDTIYIFAADGQVKASREFAGMAVAHLIRYPARGKDRVILAGLIRQESLEPVTHAFLDARTLQDIWTDRQLPGEVGTWATCPLPDGGEGLLMNAWLLDGEGRPVRRLPQEAFADEPHVHADYIALGDLNGDGRPEIVYCVEYHGYCEVVALDLDFQILFRQKLGHAQVACVLPPCGTDPGVAIVNDRSGCETVGLNASGVILWRQRLLAYPSVVVKRNGDTYACMTPHRMMPVAPALMDRWGRVRERFQEILNYQRPTLYSRYPRVAQYRSQDIGRTYSARTADWDGDGAEELALYDRHNVWVYASPPSGGEDDVFRTQGK
jgi:hypothetical protein